MSGEGMSIEEILNADEEAVVDYCMGMNRRDEQQQQQQQQQQLHHHQAPPLAAVLLLDGPAFKRLLDGIRQEELDKLVEKVARVKQTVLDREAARARKGKKASVDLYEPPSTSSSAAKKMDDSAARSSS